MRLFSRHNSEPPHGRRSFSSRVSANDPDSRKDYTFRRGRTLTGSVSSSVYTTNETKADLKSSRVHTHMLVKKRRHLGGLFFLTVIAATILFLLMNQFTASVLVQATPDPSLKLDDGYTEAIATYMADHPAERWRLFMNTERLLDYVQTVAPEVKDITVTGPAGFGASLFTVSLRIPIASWDINGERLYVDETGVPFSRNYFSAPSLTVTDRSGVPVSPGQTVASNRFMGFVGQVIGRAKTQGYSVTGIMIPPGMTRQIEVRLAGVGYPIKFSSDRPAGEEVEDMARAVGWMKERQVSPEYIDVRVKGKVFYR